MQPRNLSLGVAKQLGPDGPGEGRQARAGALCALACVIFARHLRKEVLKRMGRAGREKKRGKTARLVCSQASRGQSDRLPRCQFSLASFFRDCLKQVYVNVKDQSHATTAMQNNHLLHERIKHVYVNVTEQ